MNFEFIFMVTTKYWKTQSRILEYIVKHRIPRGGVLPTEKKMSELFGVSLITIRKAVSNLEQEKILRREQGRGTFLQKDLTESPPKNGELLYLEMLPRVKTIYAPNAFPWTDEYLEKLRHMGWKVSVLFSDPKPEANALKRLRKVKGVIAPDTLSREWACALRSLNLPCVITGMPQAAPEGFPIVMPDYSAMTELLTEKLLSEGGRKFALFPGGRGYPPGEEMIRSLSDTLRRHGIVFPEEFICYSHENGVPGQAISDTVSFLRKHPECDAFLVETQAFIPMMTALYRLPEPRKPLVGILSPHPRFLHFTDTVHEAFFPESSEEKALDSLLTLINGGEIPPVQKIAPQFSPLLPAPFARDEEKSIKTV